MFVTLFCAKLDFATGELWFSNAGHNPPLLIRRGRLVDWLKLPPGLVLGALPGSTFRTEKIVLEASVKAFATGAAQSDDITLLAVQYTGRSAPVLAA